MSPLRRRRTGGLRETLHMKMIKGRVLIQFSHHAWQGTQQNPLNLQGTIMKPGEHEHMWPQRGERESVVQVEFLLLVRGASPGRVEKTRTPTTEWP